MQNVNYNFSFQEVWDKDPLSQERMGQIGFTTDKLKDLGMVRTFFLSVFELGLWTTPLPLTLSIKPSKEGFKS